MTDRELMQQALDALEWCYDVTEWPANGKSAQDKAIEALRARLAQPEQEIESDQDHVEDDGCPTEKAVLQRFWREHQMQEPVAWIPVSEAMPKSNVIVLACYKNSLGNVRRIRAQWTAAKTEEASSDWDFGEYDEAEDCYWTPEGWYECIDNWDEYSSIAVHEGEITHWMPLPNDPYAAPPQREWQGLTDEEIQQIEMSASSKLSAIYLAEAQLKGKNA